MPFSEGDIAYSEGAYDELNQYMWNRLLWSPNRWSDLGGRLLRRGKRKTVVVAALANRWVRWLHHELQR